MIKHIPNFLTLCNLACGCYGIIAVFNGDIQTGAIMIWVGAIFDFFDGFSARMLKKFSAIGKDLDSLADLITFCFLPATIIFSMITQEGESNGFSYMAYLIVIFGALRLARFNNDTRQTDTFYGLPVPAVAIFVSVFPFIKELEKSAFSEFLLKDYTLIGIAVLLSLMMVSDIKLISLKFKDFAFSNNWSRYLLIVISLILLAFLKIMALPLIIVLYVVLSLTLKIAE